MTKEKKALEGLKKFQGDAYFAMQSPTSYEEFDVLVKCIVAAVAEGKETLNLKEWAEACSK